MIIFIPLILSLHLQMHPWTKIVNGNIEEKQATICFMCLQLTPLNSNEVKNKFKKHMTKAHSATCAMEKLAEMCAEAEEKEEREGLNLNDIIEEERERQEAAMKKRAESGGLMGIFRRKQEVTQPEIQDIIHLECFLCQGGWTGTNKKDFEKHLEIYHKAIFGIKEITKLSGNPTDESEVTEVAATEGDDDNQEEEDPAPSEIRVERETGAEDFATSIRMRT